MKLPHALLLIAASMAVSISAIAQPPTPPPPQPIDSAPRVDARREVIVRWTLGDQAWNFDDIRTAYEPVRGYLEPRPNQGTLAVWKLRMIKDFEEGAARLHEEMRGSPFKVVLLDADRTVINPDVPFVQITPVSGKMDDTIELLVGLPDAQILKDVKMIRVQRRTDVGF
ncbi:MAG TPA: hypothetical protein VGI40_19780 [Pirellulaceae bacterium]|jgi:hypothetical protein